MSWNGFKQHPKAQEIIKGLELIPDDWALTPVSEKRPYRTNWQYEEPLPKEQVKECILNGTERYSRKKQKYYIAYDSGYGVRLGDISNGLIAVDVDGDSAQKLLHSMAGDKDIPQTVAWTSGKQGRYQLLFRVPQVWRNTLQSFNRAPISEWKGARCGDGEQIEIRYNGSQSVLPPSYHPETGNYEWLLSPQDCAVAEAPRWLLEVAKQYTEPETKPQGWDDYLSRFQFRPNEPIPLIDCLSRANRELVSSGVAEGSRDNSAIAVAMDAIGTEEWLRNAGQAYDGNAEDIIREFCSRCSPPLSEKDINRIYKSAQKRSKGSAIANGLGDDALKALVAGYFWRKEKPDYQVSRSVPSEKPEEKKSSIDIGQIKQQYQELRESVAEVLEEDDLLQQQFLMTKLAKAFGVKTEYLEKIAQDIQHEQENEEFRWVEDELAQEDEQREFLCPKHIARQSVQVLVSEGGTGKTMLTNNAAKSIATGDQFLGEPCKKGKSLILQSDTPRAEAIQYFRQAGFDEIPTQSVAVHYSWSFNQLGKLEHWLATEGFDLVVVDSLTAANIGSDIDENSSLYAQGLTRLAKLGEKYDTTFIVLHHANFQGQPRGSTAIKAACTELLHLEKDKESDDRWLYRTKSRTGFMEKLRIQLDDEHFTWSVVDAPDETIVRADTKENVIDHLERHCDTEFTAAGLVKALNLSYEPKLISRELRYYARLGHCKARAEWFTDNDGTRQKVIKFQGFDTGKKEKEAEPTPEPEPVSNGGNGRKKSDPSRFIDLEF